MSSQDLRVPAVGASGRVEPVSALPPAFSRALDDAQTAGRVDLSIRGQFMSKVQAVAKVDPAQARHMLLDLAGRLRTQALEARGARSAYLTELADSIQKAADSGDLSVLRPAIRRAGAAGAYATPLAVTRSSR
jgi:hypothetical protein